MVISASDKVVTIFFMGYEEHSFIDYFTKERIISGENKANILQCYEERIQAQKLGLTKKVLFHQDTLIDAYTKLAEIQLTTLSAIFVRIAT